MASMRGFNRTVYIQLLNNQDTWGTGAAAAGNDAEMYPVRVDGDPFQLGLELIPDTDLVGGAEEATGQDELSRTVTGTLSQPRAYPHFLGFVCANGLGAESHATVTGCVVHEFTPYTTDSTIPFFTVIDYFSSASPVYIEWPDCMVNSFTISAERKGWLSCSADIIGSGRHVVTTGFTVGSAASAITAEPFLKAGDAFAWIKPSPTGALDVDPTPKTLDLDAGGSGTDVKALVRSFNWTYNNNISTDDLYEFGSNDGSGHAVMGRAERMRRTQEVSFTLELENLTYYNYLASQTELALEVEFISATLSGGTLYYGAQFQFPSIKLLTANITGGTDKLFADFTGRVMVNDESTPSVTAHATVWNLQAAYLV